MKKIHALVFSPRGGTAKVVQAVINGMGQPAEIHDLTLPEQRPARLEFGPGDLVVFAFPVYGGRAPVITEQLFSRLRGNDTPAVLLAVYGNREYEGALLDMDKLARQCGFAPFAASAAIAQHSVFGELAAGRPDVTDMDKLAAFGLKALQLAGQMQGKKNDFIAPGFYPAPSSLPKGALIPITAAEVCVKCGQCVPVCPNSAITKAEPDKTDREKCICCMACVGICPVKARALAEPVASQVKAFMLSNYSARREPEFFFSQ